MLIGIQYSVVLLPFEATGFVAKRPDTIAVSETVEMCAFVFLHLEVRKLTFFYHSTTKHPRGHGARQQQQPPAYE